VSSRATQLHESPWRGVLHVTGGGSGFLAELLSTPGASATVLEARVPYAESALTQLLGARPEQACSEATARALAMAAFQQALTLTSGESGTPRAQHLFGFACTASLATNRPKRGAHRAHLALQTATDTWCVALELEGERAREEAELVDVIWRELGGALGLDGERAPAGRRLRTTAPVGWQALVLGDAVAHASANHAGDLLLPGAFNPLHRGHRRMLEIAEEVTGLAGAFELSIANVDKPMLDYREIERRLEQFDRPVWLTHLPTFLEKARHFRGTTFVVGLDTLLRIAEPVYYQGDATMAAALAELAELQTRFVVFGRQRGEQFLVFQDVAAELPRALADLCVGVAAETFRDPISSTTLRGGS